MTVLPVQEFQEKQTDKYLLKIADDENDLHLQIFFTAPFASLVASKQVFAIVRELSTAVGLSDLAGEYVIELVPEADSIYIGSEGFWKSFVTDIDAVLKLVEGVLVSKL